MTLVKEWILPIDTVSESNTHQHWTALHKRKKKQERAILIAWNLDKPKIDFPCIVRLTRISMRFCDDDNLPTCFKKIRDQIAFHLTGLPNGRGDSDPRIKWEYDQVKGKIQGHGRGVKIEFLNESVTDS